MEIKLIVDITTTFITFEKYSMESFVSQSTHFEQELIVIGKVFSQAVALLNLWKFVFTYSRAHPQLLFSRQ